MTRTLTRRNGQRGQSLVELAVVTPVILLLAFGVVDLGRVLFAYTALEEAVQEGAYYGAHRPPVDATTTTAVITRVTSSSNHGEVTTATVTATCAPASGSTPSTVTVTASVAYPLITPVRVILGSSITLSKTFVGTNFKGSCSP